MSRSSLDLMPRLAQQRDTFPRVRVTQLRVVGTLQSLLSFSTSSGVCSLSGIHLSSEQNRISGPGKPGGTHLSHLSRLLERAPKTNKKTVISKLHQAVLWYSEPSPTSHLHNRTRLQALSREKESALENALFVSSPGISRRLQDTHQSKGKTTDKEDTNMQ